MAVYDLAAIYDDTQRRLTELAPRLSEEQLATPVPTCPGWDVHAVYSHLCGLASDFVSGVGDVNSDTATARQVAERRKIPIEEIVAAWGPLSVAMQQRLSKRRELTAFAIDAWTHDQDIHNALGIEAGRSSPGLELTMTAVWRLKRQLRSNGTAPFRVVAGDIDWLIGDEPAATTLTVEPYEFARAVLGRRSRRQILAYRWDGDPEPYATMLPVFTPPTNDIVE